MFVYNCICTHVPLDYVHIILRCYFKHFKTTQSPQIMGEKRKIPKGQKKYWDQARSSQSNVSLKLRTTSESSTFDLFTACNAGCTKLWLRENTDTFRLKSFSMAHSSCNVCIAITFLHSAHVFRCYVQEMSCQQKLETKNKSSSQIVAGYVVGMWSAVFERFRTIGWIELTSFTWMWCLEAGTFTNINNLLGTWWRMWCIKAGGDR